MFLALAYAALLTVYRRAWLALAEWQLPAGFEPKTLITVLVPERNEAGSIEACLQSILDGSYPPNLLEIIVLDDFSDDFTDRIASDKFKVESGKLKVEDGKFLVARVIRLADQLPATARSYSNKKKAIELGIAQAKGEIIVTTDADCVAPKDWLLLIAHAFENAKIKMICAPVAFHREKNLLQRFQSLDFLGLMGITGAGAQLGWHHMANGANLAYRKEVFEAVKGYAGNEHLASGDDMFLVQKVAARWPGSVAFLKSHEATVFTEAAPNFPSFWNQRLRWGTKNAANWPMRLSLLLVFIFCWSIWVNLTMAIMYAAAVIGVPANSFSAVIGVPANSFSAVVGVPANNFSAVVGVPANNFQVFLFQIAIKAVLDYLFLSEMCRFFKRKELLRWFLPSFLLHTAYIPLIGTASLFFKKYNWKGRRSS